jgi:hypothetical protein
MFIEKDSDTHCHAVARADPPRGRGLQTLSARSREGETGLGKGGLETREPERRAEKTDKKNECGGDSMQTSGDVSAPARTAVVSQQEQVVRERQCSVVGTVILRV